MRARLALVLACAAALIAAAPAAAAPRPALFKVGAASESIAPLPGVPVYAGGFGASPPIDSEHDPIEVRAFYVSNGKHAVAIATVDAQAYFSSYQEGADYGITSVRDIAAQEMSGAGGPAMSSSDIIVQATHSHAAATLEGIWGPVPLPYLKLVHDQAVRALVAAKANAREAHLQIGSYDAPWLDNIDTNQTDSYPGWAQDGQVSVLRAVSPSGGSIASFVSVPAHGDIVDGADEKKLSADYFGFVRAGPGPAPGRRQRRRAGHARPRGDTGPGRRLPGLAVVQRRGDEHRRARAGRRALDHRRHGRPAPTTSPRCRGPTRRCSHSWRPTSCPTTRSRRSSTPAASTRSTAAPTRRTSPATSSARI